MVNKKTLYFPIKIAMSFSIFTIILYEFGVWNYPTKHKAIFYIFLVSVHIMMFSGYWLGINIKMIKISDNSSDGVKLLKKILDYSFIIYILTFIPAFMIYTGEFNLSISSIWNKILIGINTPSTNYMQKSVVLPNSFWSIINILVVLTGFIRWCLIPLGVRYWAYLKRWQRRIFPIFIITEMSKWLVMGTNKGLFDLFVVISLALLISLKKEIKDEPENEKINIMQNNKKRSKKKKWIYMFIIICFIMVISFFTKNLIGRAGGVAIYSTTITGSYMTIDEESIFWKYTPEFLHSTIVNLTTYLTHGYYGLSLGLDMPFNPTFGMGGSWFLMQNFEEYTGYNIFSNTYLYKVEQVYGWSATKNWHTVYLWFANDFSFLGVPFVMFILCYIFARAWKDYCFNSNPFAFLMIILFATFFEYISANNQVFSDYTTLFAFWFVMIAWVLTKNKYYWG